MIVSRYPGTLGFVHVGMAATFLVLSLWSASTALIYALLSVALGAALGALWGRDTGRRLESSVDRGGGIVLYSQDTAIYALLIPLVNLSLYPFAGGWALARLIQSPELQLLLQLMLCYTAALWFAHEVSVARHLAWLFHRYGPLKVQWFHGRSEVGAEGMIGRTGRVRAPCAPGGLVRVGGELWRAESIDGSPLLAGEQVRVRRLNGLVLLVEPHLPAADGTVTAEGTDPRVQPAGQSSASGSMRQG